MIRSSPVRVLAALLFAWLFLLGQVSALPLAAASTAFAGDVPICHAGGDGGSAPARHGHSDDCPICVVCHALAGTALIGSPQPIEVPRPRVMLGRLVVLSPTAEPIRRPIHAGAYPTGPPTLA